MQSISLSKANLNFECETQSKIFVRKGDATELSFIKGNKIDFICTHPPYANIIKYSSNIEGDISLLDEQEFFDAISKVARESYRVLKKGKCCAIMIGDKRFRGNVVPLGFRLLQCFLDAGFKTKDIVIKEQHNCKFSVKWSDVDKKFLMLVHEYIFIFYK